MQGCYHWILTPTLSTIFHLYRGRDVERKSLNRTLTHFYQINVNNNIRLCITVGWFMMLNATFNIISVISWRSIVFVEATGVPGEHHRPVARH
jgi:hypothetical protein